MQGVADAAGYLDAVKPELTCFVKYLREYIFDFVKAKRKRELAAAAKRKAALAKAALAVENGGDIGDIVSSQEEEEAQADGDFEAEEVAWLFACKQVPAKHLLHTPRDIQFNHRWCFCHIAFSFLMSTLSFFMNEQL